MSTEAKVGGFTLLGLAILAVALIHLSGFSFGGPAVNTYTVGFNNVTGLKVASSVRYAGVTVGTVKSITPNGPRVDVVCTVKKDIPIPVDSQLTIAADGLMGEKFVSIAPGISTQNFPDGAEIDGGEEASMDGMMNQMGGIIHQIHDILASINEITGNAELKRGLIDTAINIEKVTASLARVSERNETNIIKLVQNMEMISARLAHAADEVALMVSETRDGGKTAANLRETVASIAMAAQRIDNMAAAMEDTVTDPETQNNLKETVRNAKEVSRKMNNIMSGNLSDLGTLGVEASIASHDRKNSRVQGNIDLTFGGEKSFFQLRDEGIGNDDRFSVQYGKKMDKVTARGGLIRDHFGIGIDYDADKKLRFSADAYDVNEPRLWLGARYRIAQKTYIFANVDDVTNRSDERTSYVGVRQEF
ncbi:MAG: MlaD family protein [Selenomonadaceae bacterium]|nr:MlaD family protein [Selenomonadaceae bacterium]